jgi:N-formylglutamate amidohydrolase
LFFALYPLPFHALLLALIITVPSADAADFVPGKTYFGRSNYIEYLAGDLPVVISAPHGGREKPAEMPDREKGTFAFDTNTQELIRAIGAEFLARSGHHPHLVICRVQRRKLDCNREIVEAAAGNKWAEQSWTEYHGYIEAARQAAAKFGRAFFIDLHGHGHKEAQLELGYLHKQTALALPDAALNTPEFARESSLHLLATAGRMPYAQLLRGPRSFGAFIEAEGFPATPSPRKPSPSLPYFNGGYTVIRHTRDATPTVGFQIESNSKGVRDTEASRKKFATALFNATKKFLAEHMNTRLEDRAAKSSQ